MKLFMPQVRGIVQAFQVNRQKAPIPHTYCTADVRGLFEGLATGSQPTHTYPAADVRGLFKGLAY